VITATNFVVVAVSYGVNGRFERSGGHDSRDTIELTDEEMLLQILQDFQIIFF